MPSPSIIYGCIFSKVFDDQSSKMLPLILATFSLHYKNFAPLVIIIIIIYSASCDY